MEHSACILSVGEELVRGEHVDTNSAHISEALLAAGIAVLGHATVGDDRARIASAVRAATQQAALVVMTGGLGPTSDDLTREALALVAGVPLEESPIARASIESYIAHTGRELRPADHAQLLAPQGARVITNRHGTAPALELTVGRSTVIALPGVPREMRALLAEELPALAARFAGGRVQAARRFGFCGLPESRLGERLAGLEQNIPGLAWGTAVGRGTIKVVLRAQGAPAEVEAALAAGERELRARGGEYLFGVGDTTLAAEVLARARAAHQTVAVAESCTGGRVAAELTSVSGASDVFHLGTVTYANSAKEGILGVPSATLAQHGAVSRETAEAMAAGVLRAAGASWGLSVTGIAGPTGGTDSKPVGLVYIGIARSQPDSRVDTTSHELRLVGDRKTIQERATQLALWHLWRGMLEGRNERDRLRLSGAPPA